MHCACAVLVAIDDDGRPAASYIGVSRRPCAFCALYFAAYRDKTRTAMCTRDDYARGDPGPWSAPSLSSDDGLDMQVRHAMCKNLLAIAKEKWRALVGRKHAQSTNAPGVESAVELGTSGSVWLESLVWLTGYTDTISANLDEIFRSRYAALIQSAPIEKPVDRDEALGPWI